MILSLIDAAKKDSRKGVGRFSKYNDLEKAKSIVRHQFNSFVKWNALPFSASVYFDELVEDPLGTIASGLVQLREYGVPCDIGLLEKVINNVDKTKVAEFNKGIVGRRFNEFSPSQLQVIETEFSDMAEFINSGCNA